MAKVHAVASTLEHPGTSSPRAADMLAKIRQLPAERQAELDEKIEEMLAREHDKKLLREAFELSAPSLARYWKADDDERTKEGS